MIRATGICRSFGHRRVLNGVDLSIERGEIFCIVGPNGAGKTTLLRILDLLERPDSGVIRIFGEDVTSNESKRLRARRRMSMLFQRPVILSSSVYTNVALGLRYRGIGEEETANRVRMALQQVGLGGYEMRPAKELSGGEMQRLALARAIVVEPEILFLDEPTTFLDPESMAIVRDAMLRLSRRRDMTILFTTHDLNEGGRVADRLGIMMDGRFRQTGDAIGILDHPADIRVARFVGFENILKGRVISWEQGEAIVEVQGHSIHAMAPQRVTGDATVCFRAENVTVGRGEEPHASPRNRFRGRITRISTFGPFAYLTIDCGFELVAMLTRRSIEELALAEGHEVWATVKATTTRLFTGEGPDGGGAETEKH